MAASPLISLLWYKLALESKLNCGCDEAQTTGKSLARFLTPLLSCGYLSVCCLQTRRKSSTRHIHVPRPSGSFAVQNGFPAVLSLEAPLPHPCGRGFLMHSSTYAWSQPNSGLRLTLPALSKQWLMRIFYKPFLAGVSVCTEQTLCAMDGAVEPPRTDLRRVCEVSYRNKPKS